VVSVTDGTNMWEMRGSQLSCTAVTPAQMGILTAEVSNSKQMMLQKHGIDAQIFAVFAKVRIRALITVQPL